MTNQERREEPLPPETVAALLRSALRLRKSGDRVAARALLRALSAQQPDETRIWLALATVAETRAEQRQALEQVIALDPQHPLARRGLARFGEPTEVRSAPPGRPARGRTTPVLPAHALELLEAPVTAGSAETSVAASQTPADETALAPAPALTPVAPARSARAISWPLYVVLAVAIAIVLAAALWLRAPEQPEAARPAPTPTLPGASQQPVVIGGTAPTSPATAPSAEPSPRPTPTTREPTATATPLPQPTVPPDLAPGQVLTQAPWHASLLRPEYAVPLDGSIGALQPRGRFVLALVAIGNNGQVPARIPKDLFALVDSRGSRYLPLPDASKVYLDTYGRGQRGDLSMEEEIPAGGGDLSVPLIFDVPQGARGLTLVFGDAHEGWAVGAAAPAATAAPTP